VTATVTPVLLHCQVCLGGRGSLTVTLVTIFGLRLGESPGYRRAVTGVTLFTD
jgi:hypothetical protein